MKKQIVIAIVGTSVFWFLAGRIPGSEYIRVKRNSIYVAEVTLAAREVSSGKEVPISIGVPSEFTNADTFFSYSMNSAGALGMRVVYTSDRDIHLTISSTGYSPKEIVLPRLSTSKVIEVELTPENK